MIDEKKLLNEMIDLLAKDCKDMELCGKIVGLIDAQPTIQPQGIDKDRLIEQLGRLNQWTQFAEHWFKVEEVYALIKSQPTSDGWIPVSSGGYPTEEGWYWLTEKVDKLTEKTYGQTTLTYWKLELHGAFEDYMDWLQCEVIAWKPAVLPQPYKENM